MYLIEKLISHAGLFIQLLAYVSILAIVHFVEPRIDEEKLLMVAAYAMLGVWALVKLVNIQTFDWLTEIPVEIKVMHTILSLLFLGLSSYIYHLDTFQVIDFFLSVIVFCIGYFCVSAKLEQTLMRFWIERALGRGEYSTARKLANALYNLCVIDTSCNGTKLARRRYAKSSILLGQVSESVGNYRIASTHYDVATQLLITSRFGNGGCIFDSSVFESVVDSACRNIRVMRLFDPDRSEEMLRELESYTNECPTPEVQDSVLLAGGRFNRVFCGLQGAIELAAIKLRLAASPVLEMSEELGIVDYETGLAALLYSKLLKDSDDRYEESRVLKRLIYQLDGNDDPRMFILWLETHIALADSLSSLNKNKDSYLFFVSAIEYMQGKLAKFLEGSTDDEMLAISAIVANAVQRYVGAIIEVDEDSELDISSAYGSVVAFQGVSAYIRLQYTRAIISNLASKDNQLDRLQDISRKLSDSWNDERSYGASNPLERLLLQQEEAKILSNVRLQITKDELFPSLQSIWSSLTDGEAHIEIVRAQLASGDSEYVAFVLKAGGKKPTPQFLRIDGTNIIDQAVAEWCDSMQNLLPSQSSKYLTEKLIIPLTNVLEGKVVSLSVDGELNRLPIESLVYDDNNTFGDLFKCFYVNSARDLLKRKLTWKNTSSAPIIYAAPDYNWNGLELASEQPDNQIQIFSELLHAREEGELVQAELKSCWPESGLLMGRTATTSSIKSVASPLILHIATHAFALTDGLDAAHSLSKLENSESRVGLAFTGINAVLCGTKVSGDIEDGILSALEASALDLRGTSLVVLSACVTAQGDLNAGEGVVGLRRAFQMAGAGATITCLWDSPDKQTMLLMRCFYRQLVKGATPVDALWNAKIEVRRSFPEPFFWAGYILHDSGNATKVIHGLQSDE